MTSAIRSEQTTNECTAQSVGYSQQFARLTGLRPASQNDVFTNSMHTAETDLGLDWLLFLRRRFLVETTQALDGQKSLNSQPADIKLPPQTRTYTDT
jgi:hypothetical protein